MNKKMQLFNIDVCNKTINIYFDLFRQSYLHSNENPEAAL